MLYLKHLSCLLIVLFSLGCEQRLDEAKQVAKELPNPMTMNKEELTKRIQSREKHLKKSLKESLGETERKPNPTKQWVGPKKGHGHKAWKGSTNTEKTR